VLSNDGFATVFYSMTISTVTIAAAIKSQTIKMKKLLSIATASVTTAE
jgi:hypothetical protein